MVCVGGGLGVAPIYPQARGFKESGAYVIGVLGFRNKDLMFWEDKFRACCDELILCTDDGSAGMKGFVSDGIKVALAGHPDIDEVVAIGPPIMMKACAETTRPPGSRPWSASTRSWSTAPGMCGGCRVKVGDEVKFACVDGPDFDGHLVDFDDLMMRLRRYAEEEKAAIERWSENCRMTQQDRRQRRRNGRSEPHCGCPIRSRRRSGDSGTSTRWLAGRTRSARRTGFAQWLKGEEEENHPHHSASSARRCASRIRRCG